MCFYGDNDEDQKMASDILNDTGNIDKIKRMFKFEDARPKFSNELLKMALEIKVPVIDLQSNMAHKCLTYYNKKLKDLKMIDVQGRKSYEHVYLHDSKKVSFIKNAIPEFLKDDQLDVMVI